ncbi:MAG: hypothetical protein MK183_05300 [Verrucomicrobiales bacterium]|nr:hypothetical protein [Verrucomicrobiales bacterium]
MEAPVRQQSGIAWSAIDEGQYQQGGRMDGAWGRGRLTDEDLQPPV